MITTQRRMSMWKLALILVVLVVLILTKTWRHALAIILCLIIFAMLGAVAFMSTWVIVTIFLSNPFIVVGVFASFLLVWAIKKFIVYRKNRKKNRPRKSGK
jgi:zinc transporter ZupT